MESAQFCNEQVLFRLASPVTILSLALFDTAGNGWLYRSERSIFSPIEKRIHESNTFFDTLCEIQYLLLKAHLDRKRILVSNYPNQNSMLVPSSKKKRRNHGSKFFCLSRIFDGVLNSCNVKISEF